MGPRRLVLLVSLGLLLALGGTAAGADRLRTASATDRAAMMRAEKVLPGHKPLRAWVWGTKRRYGVLCYRVGGQAEPSAFTRIGPHRFREGISSRAPMTFINAYSRACRRAAT